MADDNNSARNQTLIWWLLLGPVWFPETLHFILQPQAASLQKARKRAWPPAVWRLIATYPNSKFPLSHSKRLNLISSNRNTIPKLLHGSSLRFLPAFRRPGATIIHPTTKSWTSSASKLGRAGPSRFFSTVHPGISAILFAVRKLLSVAIILLAAGASVVIAREAREASSQQPTQTPQQRQSVPQQGGAQETATQQQPPAQIVPPSATHAGPIVILNPAHG